MPDTVNSYYQYAGALYNGASNSLVMPNVVISENPNVNLNVSFIISVGRGVGRTAHLPH